MAYSSFRCAHGSDNVFPEITRYVCYCVGLKEDSGKRQFLPLLKIRLHFPSGFILFMGIPRDSVAFLYTHRLSALGSRPFSSLLHLY